MEVMLSDYVCNDLVHLILSFAWPKKINVIREENYGKITRSSYFREIGILEQACKWGHWNLALKQMELISGEEINAWYVKYAIGKACKYGHAKLADKILSFGVNLDMYYDYPLLGSYSNKILDEACKNKHVDVVKFIVTKSNPDLNCISRNASRCGNKEIINILSELLLF